MTTLRSTTQFPARIWRRARRRPWRTACFGAFVCGVVAYFGFALWSAAYSARLHLTSTAPTAFEIWTVGPRRERILSAQTPLVQPLNLPHGDYELRTIGDGELGDSLRFELHHDLFLNFDQRFQRFSAPFVADHLPDVVDLGRERGLVQFTRHGLRLRAASRRLGSPAADEKLWTLDLTAPPDGEPSRWPGWNWGRWAEGYVFSETQIAERPSPHVVREFVDLDGDGVGDLICAGRHQAWLLAVSGATGRPLWFAPLADELRAPPGSRGARSEPSAEMTDPEPASDVPDSPASNVNGLERIGLEWPDEDDHARWHLQSAVLAPPLPVGDVNADGAVDFVVSAIEIHQPAPHADSVKKPASPRCRWIAVSGRTGESLWEIDLALVQSLAAHEWHDTVFTDAGSWIEFFGDADALVFGGDTAVVPWAPSWIRWGNERRLALLTENIELVDPANGQRQIVVSLETFPGVNSIVWGDVDGDRHDDLVILEYDDSPENEFNQLSVYSLVRGESLLSRQVESVLGRGGVGKRPLVVDLDGDAHCEIALVTESPISAGPRSAAQLLVLDGVTGGENWRRSFPISHSENEVPLLLAGPDINGDSVRDLFLASISSPWERPQVEALSGRTGEPLWQAFDADPTRSLDSRRWDRSIVVSFRWWNSALDGWPQLVVQVKSRDLSNADWPPPSSLTALSAGTGRIARQARQVDQFAVVDLDQDGQEELLAFREGSDEASRRVSISRGAASAWRRASTWNQAELLDDLNGDDVSEVYVLPSLLSGATGSRLEGRVGAWFNDRVADESAPAELLKLIPEGGLYSTSTERRWMNRAFDQPRPRDFDQDGIPDLLLNKGRWYEASRNLGAISSRSGQLVSLGHWDRVPLGFLCGDVNRDDIPDLVLWGNKSSPIGGVYSSFDELRVVDGATRRTLWSRACATSGRLNELPWPFLADCDRDGQLDVVYLADSGEPPRWGWEARRGDRGELIWRRESVSTPRETAPRLWTGVATEMETPNHCPWVDSLLWTDAAGSSILVRGLAEDNLPSHPTAKLARWRIERWDAASGETQWSWEAPFSVDQSSYATRLFQFGGVQRTANERRIVAWSAHVPTKWWELDERGRAIEHEWPLEIVSRGEPPSEPLSEPPTALPSEPRAEPEAASAEPSVESRASSPDAELAPSQDQLWAYRAAGSDTDILIAHVAGRLVAIAPGQPETPLWSLDLTRWSAVSPAVWLYRGGRAERSWLVVNLLDSSRLAGIDPSSGQVGWTCPIPYGFRNGFALGDYYPPQLLEGGDDEHAPRIIFSSEDVLLARQATLLDPHEFDPELGRPRVESRPVAGISQDERILGDEWRRRGLSSMPSAPTPARDPRWGRRLPWTPHLDIDASSDNWADQLVEAGRFLKARWQPAFLAAGVFVIPACFVGWTVRRRQFSLRQLLFLPVVIGLAITAARLAQSPELRRYELSWGSWGDPIGYRPVAYSVADWWCVQITTTPYWFALLYAPLVYSAARWMLEIVRGHSRSAVRFAVGWVLTTAIVAIGLIVQDRLRHPWIEPEYYWLDGWPRIWWEGYFAWSWLACLGWFAHAAWMSLRKILQRTTKVREAS